MMVGVTQKNLIFLVLLAGWATSALSIGNPHKLRPFSKALQGDLETTRKLDDHSLVPTAESKVGAFSFDLRAATKSLGDVVKARMSDFELHPSFELRAQEQATPFMLTWAGIEQSKYKLFFDNVEVCGYEVSAHLTAKRQSWIKGAIPVVSTHLASVDTWPELDIAIDVAKDDSALWGLDTETSQLMRSQKCWRVEDGNLIPAWLVVLKFSDGLPYEFLVDEEEVFSKRGIYFDVSGQVRGYVKNSTDGSTETVTIDDFVGNQTLETTFFKSSPQGVTATSESDHNFIYDPSTETTKFEEATAFHFAHSQHEFMKGIGYSWQGAKPLTLETHNVFEGGDVNNARYIPEINGSGPFIQTGDGDGVNLLNLGTDRDVIAHEFGHHVVFRTLTSTQDQSLVLHEALADYWAFTKSGDACLGESVCPQNGKNIFTGGFCWVANQCLRSGETSLTYNDPSVPPSAHLLGQVVSGMLWDLRTKDSIPASTVDSLVHNAIDLLQFNSGYRDMILALLYADQSFHSSTYGPKIYLRAVARGFGEFIDDIECNSEADCNLAGLPALTGDTSSDTDTGSTSSSSKSSGSSSTGCGVIHSASGSSAPWSLLLVLLMPIFIAIPNFRTNSNL